MTPGRRAQCPPFGSVSRIACIPGGCVRLLELPEEPWRGVPLLPPRIAPAKWTVEALDHDGRLVQSHEFDRWTNARQVFEAMVSGGEASAQREHAA